MRKFCFIILVFFSWAAKAQPFGNEWVEYSKIHAKIKISKEGWYRIPYATLASAFPDLATKNPENLVLFRFGKKVPVYVSATTAFGSTDYIEFYGKGNDGELDSFLYAQSNYQLNPYYSNYTDTAVYFLTFNNASNNPRFTLTPNNVTSPPPVENYFWFTTRQVYSNNWFGGHPYWAGSTAIYKSTFDDGEGFCSGWINNTSALFNMALNAPSLYTADGTLMGAFKMNYASRSDELHQIEIKFNGTIVHTNSYNSFNHIHVAQNIPISNLGATNTATFDELSGVSGNANVVSFAELTYPRKFELGNSNTFQLNLQPSSANRYLEINNFVDNSSAPILYDLENGYMMTANEAPGVFPKKYLLPSATGIRKLYIRSDTVSTYKTISAVDTITFIDYANQANQASYIIISHPKLMTDSAGTNVVNDYVSYRNSAAGGAFKANAFNIDQLCDQFGFGNVKSPLSIMNFLRFASISWSGVNQPKFVLILGKGREYRLARSGGSWNQVTVPAFGQPASDILLTSDKNVFNPNLPIGRIPAESRSFIQNYLDKVKEYENELGTYGGFHQTKTEKLWMKRGLHFNGGEDYDQIIRFGSYLHSYKLLLEDTSWGMRIKDFVKDPGAPIDYSQGTIIQQQVDSGISVMTMFGHSAKNFLSIDINPISNWNNRRKYPVLVALGCNLGHIHDATPGIAENYTNVANKGLIAVLSTPAVSVTTGLHSFATNFFSRSVQNNYKQSLGKLINLGAKDVDQDPDADEFAKAIAYEITLLGDPAIRFNQYDTADYEIDNSSLYFDPIFINSAVDSFDANLIVTNLGRAYHDSIEVFLSRTTQNSFNTGGNPTTQFDYIKKVKAPLFQDTVRFRLPVKPSPTVGLGQNTFNAYVEYGQRVSEISEMNNGIYNFNQLIYSDDIIPIYPYEFAIVPKQNPVLKASTVDPFALNAKYKIQIDTSELFRAPLATGFVTQVGGVVHWQVPITFKDSTVYYWRVSRDSTSPSKPFQWRYSSFLYLRNEYPGWNQSHYYQYKKDDNTHYVYIDNDRVFKFVPNVYDIQVSTGWADAVGGNKYYQSLGWEMNNIVQYYYTYGNCGGGIAFQTGLSFAVIDNITGEPWENVLVPGTNFDKNGAYHCSSVVVNSNGFDFNINGNHPMLGVPWSQVLNKFLDSIPPNFYVACWSVNKVNWSLMDTAILNKLYSMGALGLPAHVASNLQAPYIFFTQKGNPTLRSDYSGVNYSTELTKHFLFNTNWHVGKFTSTKIGPAYEWGSFHWRHTARENPTTDEQSVNIIGIQANGAETVLLNTTALDTALTWIDPLQYPFIRLEMNTEDTITKTPTQIYYWRVLYKKPPEAAINPAAHFKINNDSLSLGDTLRVEVAIENVTETDMDSLWVNNMAQNNSSNYISSVDLKYDSLLHLDTMILKSSFPTNGTFAGMNKYVIEANPYDNLTSPYKHQLEQFHFNNFAYIQFNIETDKINPLLDVTFDGRHILNGDLVSAKPQILISLKDENKYFALNDTSLLQVYLRYPGEATARRLAYDNQTMTFYPATGNLSKNNRAKIDLKPEQLPDGMYELIIKDRDVSGNSSSHSTVRIEDNQFFYDYKITFQVVNKSMISNVLNYPNPFTTSTRFIFTLTGSEIPTFMKIQIMTVTGTVVKEITKDDLGPIVVGRNISQYAWDGRDQYGDKLANGVYFYRVVTELDKKQVDKLASSNSLLGKSDFDKYFKQGIGKLVILR